MFQPVKNIAQMMRKALNTLDYRLMDHGERVAYLVLKQLQQSETCCDKALLEACYLSMFHDIGAFKTEHLNSLSDINTLFSFELKHALEHATYSYLFLKNFSFLKGHADAILYHHVPYDVLKTTECANKTIASMIFLADKVDIFITKGTVKTVRDVFAMLRNPVFNPQAVELLCALEIEQKVISKTMNGQYLDEFIAFLTDNPLNEKQVTSLIGMLPYAIDFRSEHTVTHTVTTVEVSETIARLMDLPHEDVQKVYYGALLHDVGKIATSKLILEKPSKLSDFEFGIMKNHVSLSEQILKDNVHEEVLSIAIRHHEKLNGTGYPYGLTASDLNLNERIVAVADIFSALTGRRSYKEPFPTQRVKEILGGMGDKNELCWDVLRVVFDNFEEIYERAIERSMRATKRYEHMSQEYEDLTARNAKYYS